jgi:hypothetical protein
MATRIIKEPKDNPSLANPLVPTHDAEAAARSRKRVKAEEDDKMPSPYKSRRNRDANSS